MTEFTLPLKFAMASSSKGSKSGGVSFDALCKGQVKDYSFNLSDLRGKKKINERKELLIQKITDTMASLESTSDKKIQIFSIGKTYAEATSDKPFKSMNKDAWRKGGISSRWREYRDKAGYDGLVVLGAITNAMLDKTPKIEGWGAQEYALALEVALIAHYVFDDVDPRVGNKSTHPGRLKGREDENTSSHPGDLKGEKDVGFVIYLAFKYEETKETEGERKVEKTEDGVEGKDSKEEEESEKSEESEGTVAEKLKELSLK